MGLAVCAGHTMEGLEHRALSCPEGTCQAKSLRTLDSNPAGQDSLLGFTTGEGLGLPEREPLGQTGTCGEQRSGAQGLADNHSPCPPRSGPLTTALNSICSAHCPHHAPIVQRPQKSKLFVSLSACPQCPSGGLALSHRAGWTLGLDVHQWMAGGRWHRLLLMGPVVSAIHSAPSLPPLLFPSSLCPHLCMSLYSPSSVSTSSVPL